MGYLINARENAAFFAIVADTYLIGRFPPMGGMGYLINARENAAFFAIVADTYLIGRLPPVREMDW